jgi:hypothetical protein
MSRLPSDAKGEDSIVDDTQLERAVGKGQAIVYHAIGRVENDSDELAPPPEIRSLESRIIIDPSLAEGLQGKDTASRAAPVASGVLPICFLRLKRSTEGTASLRWLLGFWSPSVSSYLKAKRSKGTGRRFQQREAGE